MAGSSPLPDASGASPTTQSSSPTSPTAPTLRRPAPRIELRPTRNSQHLAYHSNMPEVTSADRQNAILDKARKLYSDGKFKAALAAFKEVSSQTCTGALTNDWLTSAPSRRC